MMKVVRYDADGMKQVLIEEITMSEFWNLFRKKRARIEKEMEDRLRQHEATVAAYKEQGRTYTGSVALKEIYRTGGNAFEVTDEALASGCSQYVARPDNWPETNGEPH